MENTQELIMIPEKKKSLSYTQLLIIYFFVYSFLGWSAETIYGRIILGYWPSRGFLFGPICPIYGYGGIIMLLFLSKYKNNIFKLFGSSIIVFSLFEYIVGYILEAVFQLKWWDYTNEFLNLNGRITLVFSLVWGFAAIIFFSLLHTVVENVTQKLTEKSPYIITKFILTFLIAIYIIDTIYSIIFHMIK